MGVDVADFENSGRAGIAITNFDNEMIGLYRTPKAGAYDENLAGVRHWRAIKNDARIRLRVFGH